MSEDETSTPTTAQYRTVPLRPLNVTFDKPSITSTSFRVFWNPPEGMSEFDKYQISLGGNKRLAPVTRNRDDESKWEFKDLEPGKTYQVVVKTVSGKVTSWPANGDVTLSELIFLEYRYPPLFTPLNTLKYSLIDPYIYIFYLNTILLSNMNFRIIYN